MVKVHLKNLSTIFMKFFYNLGGFYEWKKTWNGKIYRLKKKIYCKGKINKNRLNGKMIKLKEMQKFIQWIKIKRK